MRLFTYFFLAFAGLALAHPEPDVRRTPEEIVKREVAQHERRLAARNCAHEIEVFNARRREARAIRARGGDLPAGDLPEISKRYKPVDTPPYYHHIQNNTCITTPEVSEGPFFVKDEYVRKDIRETQCGITLVLDIGVLDIRTCKPLPNAYVDIWHANATGFYSGFTTVTLPPPPANLTNNTTFPSPPMSDKLTFLRGGQPTNKNGITEVYTIYPGFYTGRTIHIHVAVITEWKENRNKTIASDKGHLRHEGQLFFEESLNNEIIATDPYNTNKNPHTFNDQDFLLPQGMSNGYNAFMDVKRLGKDIERSGLLGYITIGVDTQAEYKFTTNNTYNP